jgi:sporulation protein YlmC with PRC-barrel domain
MDGQEAAVELSEEPFSDLIGKPVCDSSGRRLGRAFEVRAHWDGERVAIDEILVGRGSLLKRLRGPGARARGVRWESVIEVGDRLVVRV